jgi:predicted transcriptional regulator
MTAAELLTNNIPPLQITDSVQQALDLMHEFHVKELPVVMDFKPVGLLYEEDLEDKEEFDTIEPYIRKEEHIKVHTTDFFLAVLKTMHLRKLSIVPVVKEDGEYMGVITEENLLNAASHYNSATEPGAIIILQMSPNSFSISELGRIVESNDAQIIHLNTWKDISNGQLMVAIKINKPDLQDILATLERYEYNVIQYFGENLTEEELKLNYDHLMNYLNI